MLKIFGYLSITLLLFSACQNQDSEVQIYLQEPAYSEVKYEHVQIKGLPAFYYGFSTCIFENYLLLYENTPFRRYHLIDLNNQKLIRTIGQEEGPFKINYSYCNCQLIKEEKSIYTILNDGGQGHIMLQLNDEQKNTAFSHKRLSFPESKISTGTMYFSKDRKKMFGFSSAQSSIFKYDLNSQKVSLTSSGPDLKVNTDPITRSNIFFAGTAVDKNTELFGIAYSYFNLIEIFDTEFNLLQAISIGKPSTEIPKTVEGIPVESTIRYSGFLLFGKDNIYVPFFNQERNTINNNNFLKILVINLQSHSIKGIKIPKTITSLSVDAEEKYLYATTEDDSNKDGNLIRINLKELDEKE